MKKREKIIVISALAVAIAVIILGIIASFFVEKPQFDSITGYVVSSCSNAFYPECNADCPDGLLCLPDAGFGGCICSPGARSNIYCSDAEYPLCNGYCTLGLECQHDSLSETCRCMPIDNSGESLNKQLSSCNPDLECTEWTSCLDGEQVRVCIDKNNCFPKKEEKRACVVEPEIASPTAVPCVPNWQCSDWSECKDNKQTRECSDINNCNTEENKSAEVKECVSIPSTTTDKTAFSNDKTNKGILTPLVKTGLILLVTVISTIVLLIVLIFKKPKTANKLVPLTISLFIILNISGLIYFSYKGESQTKITANVVSIDDMVPSIDQDVTNNMFIDVYKGLSPLKKAATVSILVIISTLILILALVLTKKTNSV